MSNQTFDMELNRMYNANAMIDDKSDKDESIVPEAADGIVEETDIEDVEATLEKKHKELKNELKRCEEEKRNYLEDLQRTKADFLNSKKRLDEQLSSDRERITDKLLLEFLPLIDSLELALKDSGESLDENWKAGFEAIHAQFLSLFTRYGVTEIDCTGKPFDPHRHEAVANVKVKDPNDDHRVMELVQKGYERDGKILRPARVTVGTHG